MAWPRVVHIKDVMIDTAKTEVPSEFYTPTQVSKKLQTSANSVIARFSGMAGVLILPDIGNRKKRERYRQIRVPKHILDRFIETHTLAESTPLGEARNRRKVRRVQ
jgi:hypothetical protein